MSKYDIKFSIGEKVYIEAIVKEINIGDCTGKNLKTYYKLDIFNGYGGVSLEESKIFEKIETRQILAKETLPEKKEEL